MAVEAKSLKLLKKKLRELFPKVSYTNGKEFKSIDGNFGPFVGAKSLKLLL